MIIKKSTLKAKVTKAATPARAKKPKVLWTNQYGDSKTWGKGKEVKKNGSPKKYPR